MRKQIVDSYEKVFGDKKRIMAIFAHPDDLELYCGGTVARLIADGKKVSSIKMTSGEMGSRQEKVTKEELLAIREREDSASMAVLGIIPVCNVYLRSRAKNGWAKTDGATGLTRSLSLPSHRGVAAWREGDLVFLLGVAAGSMNGERQMESGRSGVRALEASGRRNS